MKKYLAGLLLFALYVVTTSFHPATTGSYYIIVKKHSYELQVYDAQGWLVTYPVVFGKKDLKGKMVEGDRETPEGDFTIASKRVHDKWCRILMLDYPNEESYRKFNQRKQQGLIPANAKIGGGVGIHGTWPREDFAVDRYDNWTQGCISMKNEDVKELFNMIPVGTKISIQK